MGGSMNQDPNYKPANVLSADQEMLHLLRKREEREAKQFEQDERKRIDAEENHKLRVESQKVNDAYPFTMALQWQAKCDHRKGTGGKKKWRHIDYNVNRHTFPNGLTVIKCLKCKFRAFPGDTKDKCSYTLDNFKAGSKVPNPTKKAYSEWYEMTMDENTTNTETRSEMVTQGPQPVIA